MQVKIEPGHAEVSATGRTGRPWIVSLGIQYIGAEIGILMRPYFPGTYSAGGPGHLRNCPRKS